MTNPALQRLLAERYPRDEAPRARSPTRTPAPPTPQQYLARAARDLPRGRLSRAPSDGSFGAYWSLGNYAERDRLSAIADCRRACLEDADAGGAQQDIVALANPPLTDGTPGVRVTFEGSSSAQARAERETNALLDRLHLAFPELVNNRIREIYEAGASALEWYPNRSRTGVLGVELIPPEELTPRRQGDVRQWQQNNVTGPLNPVTFVYSAFGTHGRDEYGTPAMISALGELERKANITLGVDKVIRLLAQGVFLKIGVPKPTLKELGVTSEEDPAYLDAMADHYTSYVETAASARDLGIAAFEDGTNMDVVPLTGNVNGLSNLEEMNALKVWSGLLTLPFMRGKMDSTTQALAQVVYPIQLANAMAIRQTAVRSLEFGLNLNLRLAGIPARASLAFQEPPNPFVLDRARAALTQAQTDRAYLDLYGEPYLRWAAERDGFDADQVVRDRARHPRPQRPTQSTPQGGEQDSGSPTDQQP